MCLCLSLVALPLQCLEVTEEWLLNTATMVIEMHNIWTAIYWWILFGCYPSWRQQADGSGLRSSSPTSKLWMKPLGHVMDGVPGRKDQIPVVKLINTCFRRAHSRTKCFWRRKEWCRLRLSQKNLLWATGMHVEWYKKNNIFQRTYAMMRERERENRGEEGWGEHTLRDTTSRMTSRESTATARNLESGEKVHGPECL